MFPKYAQCPLRMFYELLDLWVTLHSGTLATVCGQTDSKQGKQTTRAWAARLESDGHRVVLSQVTLRLLCLFIFSPLGSLHWHSLAALVYFWVLTVLLLTSRTTTSPEKNASSPHLPLMITWGTKVALQGKKKKKQRWRCLLFTSHFSPCYHRTF